MAKDLRSQFRPAKTDAMRQQLDKEDQSIGGQQRDGHKMENGINKFRFYPPHPGEENFFVMIGHHWGTVEGETEPVRRKVPDGKIHGGLSVDPIEAYIVLCQQKLDGTDAAEMEKLSKLTGKNGINCKTKWAAWADKLTANGPVFDLLEFSKTVRDAIKNESIIDDADEAMESEPFTDPDEGKALIVDYNAAAKKANQYYKNIKIAKTATPLTDEQLEYYAYKVKPLSQLYAYTDKHFETALEIVKFFDEENEVNLFDSDEYQETIASLKKEMKKRAGGAATTSVKAATKKAAPADDDDEDTPPPTKKAVTKKAAVVDDEEEEDETPAPKKKAKGDKFDAMDRQELKEYIAEQELPVKVMKSHSDDDIRSNIRTAEAANAEVEEEEDEEPPVINKKKAAPVDDDEDEAPKGGKKKPNLEDIKKQLRG